ncbi:MAG: SMI1/KNR4 family protein [Polyangiaceae bacterium]
MKVERGVPLVERIIERVAPHVEVQGANADALDALESHLMVELPPTLRRYLEFDFTFRSFGKHWQGKHRFGRNPRRPEPKITSVRKLAEAMTEFGWTASRLRKRVIRLPNLPGQAWNCLYLGEARRDGELPILGLVNDETNVLPFLRYTSFDLYLVEQSGLLELSEGQRLDDVESFLPLNPELTSIVPEDVADDGY